RAASMKEREGYGARGPSARAAFVSAILDIHVIAPRRAGIELARAGDAQVRMLEHLLPLRDPADGAGQREDRREHRGREADRLEDDARVEIDVRIELLLDEILVLERDPLEFLGDLQRRIVLDAEKAEHLVRRLFHHLRAGVEI